MIREMLLLFLSALYSVFFGHAMQESRFHSPADEHLVDIVARYLSRHRIILTPESLRMIPDDAHERVAQQIITNIKKNLFPVNVTIPQNPASLTYHGVCALQGVENDNSEEVISVGCDGKITFCPEKNITDCDVMITDQSLDCLCLQPLANRLMIGATDGTIMVWDYNKRELLYTFQAHTTKINALSSSCVQNRVVSCSIDSLIKIWDPNESTSTKAITQLVGHTKSVKDAYLFNRDNNVVSAGFDQTLKIWDVENRKEINSYRLPGTVNHSRVGLHPDENVVVAGLNGGLISLFDMRQKKPVGLMEGHTQLVSALKCNTNGNNVISGSWDGTVRLWDLRMLACAAAFAGHSDWIQSISTLGAFKKIISGSRDGTVKVWDASDILALNNPRTIQKSMQMEDLIPAAPITNDKRLALLKQMNTQSN